jgi:hypothetical protein
MLVERQSMTGEYQLLADEIVSHAELDTRPASEWTFDKANTKLQIQGLLRKLSTCQSAQSTNDLALGGRLGRLAINDFVALCDPVSHLERLSAEDGAKQSANRDCVRLPGTYVTFGPYRIVPEVGSEMPIGRDFQRIPYESISRLHGLVGLDQYSFYVRAVHEDTHPEQAGPRQNIWIRQPDDDNWRRLAPGAAERITPDSEVRIGGNGSDPQTGVPLVVHL